MTNLLASLPGLPGPGQPPLEPIPGSMEQGMFVRRTLTPDRDQTRAVFLHGMGGSSTNWTDLMHLLAPLFPGVAPDLPGYGYSEPSPDGKHSIGRTAQAIATLIERQDCGPVHLFGNSMGGAAATVVAATRPDLVETLILISPALMTRAALGGRHLTLAWDTLLSFQESRGLSTREAAGIQFERVMRLCYSDPSRVPPERREAALDEIERRIKVPHAAAVNWGIFRSILKASANSGPASAWAMARMVSTPTLGLYGAQDRLVPTSMAPRVAEAFERGRVVIMQDCGHVAQMEHPELTAQTVLQWMASLPIQR